MGAVMAVSFESLLSVRQIAQRNPNFSEASLRWLIFNAETNGLAPCLVRIGRRVLVNTVEFNAWLEASNRRNP
jgi:hypothetical protein